MIRELRPHQHHAIQQLRQSLGLGKRRPMVQAPTGAGKTLLAAAIVDGALSKGKRVTFCVPALSLIDQTVDAFWNEGIRDVGVIQADHAMTSSSRPVQIASVQSLQRRAIPESDIVVIDEAHRWFDIYGKWMAKPEWQKVPFIGLSATPWTKGLGKHFDDLIIAATTAELVEAGYLSKFRVYAPAHPDLTKVRTKAGDFHEGDLAEAMNKDTLVADIVETWRRQGEGRPTLCFGVDRAHAKNLQRQFLEASISAGYIDAYTPVEERDEVRRRFHAGEIKVVCNVGCLTTGVDWDVRCIILARPTKSEMLFVQIIGRGLRTADGKADCLILDHSDTHLRLGFVTDITHCELDDGKGREKDTRETAAPLPKECGKCSFLKPAKVSACPSCGFKPERQSKIECEAGDLVELSRKRKAKDHLSSADKADLYAQLKGYQQQAKCSEGRIAHLFRERTGVWPNAYRGVAAVPPTPGMLGWIRSRAIAYAKARGGAGV